jgi:hypothetical protein
MPRSQKNDNFIDKTFTIIADLLLTILPTTQREKEAFAYYRDGAICLSYLLGKHGCIMHFP